MATGTLSDLDLTVYQQFTATSVWMDRNRGSGWRTVAEVHELSTSDRGGKHADDTDLRRPGNLRHVVHTTTTATIDLENQTVVPEWGAGGRLNRR